MAYLDIFIDEFAYFSLFPYIIYDHLKCVSRLRATLYNVASCWLCLKKYIRGAWSHERQVHTLCFA